LAGSERSALGMITVAELLERRQILLERLEKEPGPHEREQIELVLLRINAALDFLDELAKE
jgi:hypothetical protein